MTNLILENGMKSLADLEQVGWLYEYMDKRKGIPPVLSLHQLGTKPDWIERPIYTEKMTPNAEIKGLAGSFASPA
jgi:hypothetical protein